MVAIAADIQLKTSEILAMERVGTRMEKPLKMQILDAEVKRATQKSMSPPNRTDSVPSSPSSAKTLKPAAVNQGTAPDLTAVIDATGKTKTPLDINQRATNRTSHPPTLNLTPDGPTIVAEGSPVKRRRTQSPKTNEQPLL